jgi:cytochrome P450
MIPLQHPDPLELLRFDPDGLAGGAAKETLRYQPNLRSVPLLASRGLEELRIAHDAG